MKLFALKLRQLGGRGGDSPQVTAMRAEVLKMVALLREAMSGGVASRLAALLRDVNDNRAAIQKGLIVWIHLVETFVQEAERTGKQGPRKKRQVKAALFRILTDPKAQLPGIPAYLYPLVMDIAVEWMIEAVVQVENGYGLWNSRSKDDESRRMANFVGWLKQVLEKPWEWLAGVVLTTYFMIKYRQPLQPELRKAVENVEAYGILADKRSLIHSLVEFVQFVGMHGEQVIAGIKLIFDAVYQAESFLELDGPGKKQYAHDLIIATLEELGFPVGSGLFGMIADVFINAGIESAWSIFNERAPESFKHRRHTGSTTGLVGAPASP
jgi:hypothetical protein